jgi:D-glycero-D-manno-heptose 1,7-bisphosphate phosphatase
MSSADLLACYKLFIFDADDTLRRTILPGKPCPHAPGEWVLMPGVRERLSAIDWDLERGPYLGIASNQDQVGYGHLTLSRARDLLRDLAHSAAGVQPSDAALQLCPHTLEESCHCRKPEPGMLLAIMEHYRAAPKETLFVGNHETDRSAAARAGVDFGWSFEFFAQQQ